METADEVSIRLGFVEAAKSEFAGLAGFGDFVEISPSRVEIRGGSMRVEIEREPFGYEIVGRLRSGQMIATFDELQRLLGKAPDVLRPVDSVAMRKSLGQLAHDVVPIVLRIAADSRESKLLFGKALQVRRELNRSAGVEVD